MTKKRVMTRKEAREAISRQGKSLTQWAEERGMTLSTVRDVLRKERPCHFGLSHKAAVLLGIKDGVIDEEVRPFSPKVEPSDAQGSTPSKPA
jgi:gp16 family phage-associated protein